MSGKTPRGAARAKGRRQLRAHPLAPGSRSHTRSRPPTPDGAAPKVPPADDEWYPIAVRRYASLTDSGQMQFYGASDWTMGQYAAEATGRS
ncbi:phage terminase small subunit [Streptomyces sp. NPDC001492]